MAVPPLVTAQDNWKRRVNTFRQQGIPDSAWTQLYQRDMTGVYSGQQGMSDAEIYAGVQSVVKGPQIQDPQPQHGHGGGLFGVLDTVANVVGNVPRDVGGIITGFPHGLAHAVWDLPKELPATWDLITHLGDDSWLRQKGYLAAGDKAHGLWGDLGQLLRELNGNQSENLLPYLPFLSDLANMTTGRGRNYLMQHPVGSLMDAWPVMSYGSKLAMAGKDFGVAPDMQTGLAQQENRFAAAGRAMQKGNPIKAGVSALASMIPSGEDVAHVPMNLRERSLYLAHLMGADQKSRTALSGAQSVAQQEYSLRINKYLSDNFTSDIIKGLNPKQKEALFLGHNYIDPATRRPFQSRQEYQQWVDTLSPEEQAAHTSVVNANEALRQSELDAGLMKEWTEPDGTKMQDAFNSPVFKAWEKFEASRDGYRAVTQQIRDINRAQGGLDTAALGDLAAKSKALSDAMLRDWKSYAAKKADYVPLHGQLTAQAIFRNQAADMVRQDPSLIQPGWRSTIDVNEALDVIAKSQYIDEFERMLGPQVTAKLVANSINEWHKIEKEMGPVQFIRHTDAQHVNNLLHPAIDPTDTHIPQHLRGIGKGIMLNRSVLDPVAALTAQQAELFRHDIVNDLITNHLEKGFVEPKDKITEQYAANLRKAVSLGRLNMTPAEIANEARKMTDDHYAKWNPKDYGVERPLTGDQVIAKSAKAQLDILVGKQSPALATITGNKIIRKGTALYKFSVLTGPRHLAHVAFGGLMFLEGRYPLAPRQLLTARKLLRGELDPREFGLDGLGLSGLRGRLYQVGHTNLENVWMHAGGQRFGEDLTMEAFHEARQRGVKFLEWFPNKLARLEENIMDMYRVSGYLEAKRGGMTSGAALEAANKVFVDINNMSVMERTVIKQVFPFYAFTRHLFRYLFTYPVDYPLRASIINSFGEVEQNDWNSGLPRSYQSLLFLPFVSKMMGLKPGNEFSIDTKNLNPFRSFANDFTMAGFYSSLSPFLTAPLQAIGVDTLSGTTQLYPGVIYNPQTGSLQAEAPSGGPITMAESFIPQLGLLDHYFGLTGATRGMAKYSPDAYQKQLWNMLNMPFVPNVVNVPYYEAINEIRRFRAAQAAVTAVQKDPSAANVAKLMEWNAVPFNNELVSPQSIAAYYVAVQAALDKAHSPAAPKAALRPPVSRKAQFQNF